jgi:hypothetical protein
MARDWLSLSYTDNLLLRFDFGPEIGMFGSSTLVCGVQCTAATLLQTCCAAWYVNLSWKCSEERKREQTQKAVCSYGRGKYMKGFCKLAWQQEQLNWCKICSMFAGLGTIQCMKSWDPSPMLEKFVFDECDGSENFSMGVWRFQVELCKKHELWGSRTALVGRISFLGAAVELQHLPECCCSAIKSSPLWCNQ